MAYGEEFKADVKAQAKALAKGSAQIEDGTFRTKGYAGVAASADANAKYKQTEVHAKTKAGAEAYADHSFGQKNRLSYGANVGNANTASGSQTFGNTAKFIIGGGVGVGAGAGLKGKCDFNA